MHSKRVCHEMESKKVDYTPISKYYNDTRVPSPHVLEFWLSKTVDLGKVSTGSMVLDVGCGTGIYTIPLTKKTDALVLGLDSARDMIKKARIKEDGQRVEWQIGDAENLPFNNAHFDCAIMTMMIHQIVNKKKATDEIYRVLKKNGTLVIMTKSHGQLKRSVIMDFPKIRQIDLKRFPTIPMLRYMLLSAGFENTRYHVVSRGVTKVSMEEYLEKIRKKFISTLTLLSEEEFQRGLKIFEKRLRDEWGKKDNGNEIIYENEYTFVVGEK
jgi:ubiquinone/menaquinone biosynthesis C-methylase UbiE